MTTFTRMQLRISETLDCNLAAITNDATLRGDLEADHFDLQELAMEVEEEFNIELTDEEMDRVKTVGDLLALVEGKI